MGSNVADSPVEIVRKVALTSGGEAYPIFAPLMLEDPATAAVLRRQPDVAAAMRLFDDVTTAVASIGSWEPEASQLLPAVSETERAALRREGVRADLAASLINDDEEIVRSRVSECTIAISPEQVRRIPRVIGVAACAEKGLAIVAAARAGMMRELVVDRALAEVALEARPVGEVWHVQFR